MPPSMHFMSVTVTLERFGDVFFLQKMYSFIFSTTVTAVLRRTQNLLPRCCYQCWSRQHDYRGTTADSEPITTVLLSVLIPSTRLPLPRYYGGLRTYYHGVVISVDSVNTTTAVFILIRTKISRLCRGIQDITVNTVPCGSLSVYILLFAVCAIL